MIFIYNALSILLIGYLLKRKMKTEKVKRRFIFFAFFQMFLIQALRSPYVGTDTLLYVTVYERFLSSEYYSYLFTHYEPGYAALIQILKNMGCDSQILLVIVSAITMVGFALFIYRNSDDPHMSTFLFACMFFPNSFNICRQYLASAIAINALPLITQKKYAKALIVILIASMFHITACFMLIPLLLQFVKNWKTTRTILVLSTAIFYIFGDKIVRTLLTVLGRTFYLSGFEVNRLFRMTTALTVVFALLTWYFAKKTKDNSYKSLANLFSCVSFVNMDFGILYLKYEFFSRLIEIMNLFVLISAPNGVIHAQTKYKKIIKAGMLLLSFLLMLNSVYNSGSGVSEYSFYWN